MIIKIGTRKSPMAVAQTQIVADMLKNAFPNDEFELIKISTEGDERLDKQLKDFRGKGAFIKEIEKALIDKSIDMAVHSAKDVPTELPPDLKIGAAIKRDWAADILVSTHEHLVKKPVIGTGSARREVQLRELYPNAVIKPIRGNIGTRISKLRNGEYDAIMLAEASIYRLGIDKENGLYFKRFEPKSFTPAAGQGILAVEVRKGSMQKYMVAVNDEFAEKSLKIERSFLLSSGGGCHTPSGAYVEVSDNGDAKMYAMLYSNGKIARVKLKGNINSISGEKAAKECLAQLQ